MAIENKGNNGLVVGKTEPSTIGTYQTKGFKHEGVKGSEPVGRLNEVNKSMAITPEVLNDTQSSQKIVKDDVKNTATGNGVDGQEPVDNYKAKKSGSAGMIGASNANHA